MHLLQKILSSGVILGILLSLGAHTLTPSIAHAAAGEGTATITIGVGTDAPTAEYGSAGAAGSVVVGEQSIIRLDITVGASGIAAAEDNVTVQINTTLFPSNGWNTVMAGSLAGVASVGDWRVVYTDTDSGTTNNAAISFAASAASATGLITIQANQQMDATDIITVYANVTNTTHEQAAAPVVIQTDDTGENSLTTIGAPPTIEVVPHDHNASVLLGTNSRINVPGNTTLTITSGVWALDADDTIEITFPAHMNVAGVDAAVTGTFEDSDSITCAASGQVVTCTTDAATNASGTIIMTGITASYKSTLDVTLVEINNEGVSGNTISSDSSVAMTNISANSAVTTEDPTYEIEVTAPVSGATYTAGTMLPITWSTSGTGGTSYVTLSYSTNGGSTWNTIITNTVNDGSYTWTVPDIDAEVIVRAEGSDLVLTLSSDESASFTIGAGAGTDEETDTEEDTPTEEDEETSADMYIKGESWSTVYMIGEDGMRHPFLDSQTYFTYTDSFDDVVEVSDEELATYTIGSPVLPMAGTVLVKIQSVNSVYALQEDNTLRHITSEDLATTLYGSAWADYVIDVPVTAWGHFTIGEDIDSASDITVDDTLLKTRTSLNR